MIMLLLSGTGFQPVIHGGEKTPRGLKAHVIEAILISLQYSLHVER
jgi:hypothetical protein